MTACLRHIADEVNEVLPLLHRQAAGPQLAEAKRDVVGILIFPNHPLGEGDFFILIVDAENRTHSPPKRRFLFGTQMPIAAGDRNCHDNGRRTRITDRRERGSFDLVFELAPLVGTTGPAGHVDNIVDSVSGPANGEPVVTERGGNAGDCEDDVHIRISGRRIAANGVGFHQERCRPVRTCNLWLVQNLAILCRPASLLGQGHQVRYHGLPASGGQSQTDMIESRVTNRVRDNIEAAGISGVWASPGSDCPELRKKGAYLLAIELDIPVQTDLTRLGSPRLASGSYIYAGSAKGPGGLMARVSRHFRRDKTLRWHIDHLTTEADTVAALLIADGDECDLVQRLLASGRFETAIPSFGSSDCDTCEGHLLTPLRCESAC